MCHPVHTLRYFLHWLSTSTNLLQSSIDFTCGHHDALVVDAERVASSSCPRARRQGPVRAGRVLPPPPDAAAVLRKGRRTRILEKWSYRTSSYTLCSVQSVMIFCNVRYFWSVPLAGGQVKIDYVQPHKAPFAKILWHHYYSKILQWMRRRKMFANGAYW